jgi:hypothetical protein
VLWPFAVAEHDSPDEVLDDDVADGMLKWLSDGMNGADDSQLHYPPLPQFTYSETAADSGWMPGPSEGVGDRANDPLHAVLSQPYCSLWELYDSWARI